MQLKKKVVIRSCMGEHCGWPRCEQPWWHKGFVATSKRGRYVLGDGQPPSLFDSQKKLVFSTSHEHIHVILVTDQLNAKNYCFIISLLYSSTCFEHYVLIIRRSKLYYTASGIITQKQVYYTPLQVSSTVVLIIRRSKLCYSASGIITLKRVYYMPLHVSRTTVLIIRRSKLYYTASGIVTLCRWPSGAQVERGLCTGLPPIGVMIPDAV